MAVTVKTKKNGTHRLDKEEFAKLMYLMWQRAQARKAAREDMKAMREEEKEKK